MFLGIEMYVVNELGKIAVWIDLDPAETILEKAAGSFVGDINRLSVAIEEVWKLLGDCFRGDLRG